MKFKELEFKYAADDISMQDFIALVEKMKIDKRLMVSSYDDYFTDKTNNFIRYRYNGNAGELTIKRKTTEANNNNRIEVNLPTTGDNFPTVEAFVGLLGYEYNFSIYKTCKIYWSDNVVLVYYIVYDKEMNESRRFIEIEADEDHNWASEEEAHNKIVQYEKMLEPLGITPRNRMKKSLFELFLKESSPKS